jgi:hypothetical protein
MKTHIIPGYAASGDTLTVHIHANGHERALKTYNELSKREREDVWYIAENIAEGRMAYDELDIPRFFIYLGSTYDDQEFEVAPAWVKTLGYDGWQTDSAFSAVIVRYFDEFGYELEGRVVARIHW